MKQSFKRIGREYHAGFNSGIKHDISNPLCRDNERKVKTGIVSRDVLVKAFWQGYYDAIHGFMRNTQIYGHPTR
jgi:ribosome modulation factor